MRKLLFVAVLTSLGATSWAASTPASKRKLTLSFSRSTSASSTPLDTASLVEERFRGMSDYKRDYLTVPNAVYTHMIVFTSDSIVGWSHRRAADTPFHIGDTYDLSRRRTVTRDSSSKAWSLDGTWLIRGDSLRLTFGYRNGGTTRFSENSSRYYLRTEQVAAYGPIYEPWYNYAYPFPYNVFIVDANPYQGWLKSDTDIALHGLSLGSEYDLHRSRWTALAVGGGLEGTLYRMHQSIERVLQYEGYANSDIIAHNGHATNGLKSQREALELTDAEFTVRPFASVSTQFWPFRNTGIGLGAQGRWYPFESRSESGFESLLAPYVATTKAKSFQLTASVTLAFR